MTVRVVGKHIDTGDAIRERITERVSASMEKYFDGGYGGQVTVEKERSGFVVDCLLRLDTGFAVHAGGDGADAYQAFERAAEKIEKQLRRYNRRLKKHTGRGSLNETPASEFTITPPDESEGSVDSDNPVIIAESAATIPTLAIADAVMALDLGQPNFFLFKHSGSGRLNLVYRREDGHVGWLDPSV